MTSRVSHSINGQRSAALAPPCLDPLRPSTGHADEGRAVADELLTTEVLARLTHLIGGRRLSERRLVRHATALSVQAPRSGITPRRVPASVATSAPAPEVSGRTASARLIPSEVGLGAAEVSPAWMSTVARWWTAGTSETADAGA